MEGILHLFILLHPLHVLHLLRLAVVVVLVLFLFLELVVIRERSTCPPPCGCTVPLAAHADVGGGDIRDGEDHPRPSRVRDRAA